AGTDQGRKATLELIEVGGFAAAGRSEWRLLGKPDTHRTQSRRHIARIGVGQGPKSGGRRWLLPPVREAHKQDRRHSLLEEGELEFFKVNAIARLFQRLGHILCGTIVAEGAGGSVATTLRGDVLQHSQMPEGALACRCVEQAGAKAPSTIFSALAMRPGATAVTSAAARPMLQLSRKVFDDSIIVRPWRKPATRWLASVSDALRRNPATGIAVCCARAASAHATAAPPGRVMNSRRFMCGWPPPGKRSFGVQRRGRLQSCVRPVGAVRVDCWP